MKKFLIFLLLTAVLGHFVAAQNDSLEQIILSYENKQFTLIQNGRNMLVEHVQSNDIEKAASLQHYLETQVENEDYMVFYGYEKWLLNIWTGQYYKLLTEFRNLSDSVMIYPYNHSISPPRDLLTQKLVEKVGTERLSIHRKLDETNMAASDLEFLKLFTDWLVFMGKLPAISSAQLNEGSNKYLETYPKSDFRYFVGRHINQEEMLAKRGFGFDFFSGYGGYTGSLKSHFGHHVPFGVAFDFYYKKWVFGFRDHIGVGKLDKDIDFPSATWKNRSTFNHIIIELSAGYSILENQRVKLFPFAAVSFGSFSPAEADQDDNPEYKDLEIGGKTVPVIGLNLDFKLSNPYSKNPNLRSSYWMLRIRSGFMPSHYETKLEGFNGNSFYLTLGIGGVVRKVVKKYQYSF